jgi:hypothetical protein
MRKEHRPLDPAVEARTRGQFAGSANSRADRRHHERQHRIRGPPDDDGDVPDAYSIKTFCSRHDISEAFFHKLRALGLGPVVMKVGTRTLISRESAAEWRRAREAETQQQQEANETPARLR